ncbi:S26 family signal peptidase [Salinicola peritrichatus]|uniref:S26 family signal peptidase n=1 Tax=Salinicola peritrichatus TaxID=1267424 RepID=UPI000DA1ABE3|nr:S26 family signal peptidase [Salinicola peritrichatus]
MTALPWSRSAPCACSRRCIRLVVATLAVVGFAALAWASFVSPLPRFIYNPSDSVAVGWYRVDPHTRDSAAPPVGSLVLVPLPADAAALAARRGYLPLGIPLLKPVAAVAPQRVCVVGHSVRIDGVPVATILPVDHLGRRLPSWQHCRRLRPGELFLLSTTNPASFDSRYFGPVATSSVVGIAHPVWLETRR